MYTLQLADELLYNVALLAYSSVTPSLYSNTQTQRQQIPGTTTTTTACAMKHYNNLQLHATASR